MSPSALFVTTVPITLEAFLVPFAEHFRSQGWRIDGLANGATRNPHITGAFDNLFDVAWSRNPADPRNLIGSAGRVREIVAQGSYDLVHVHTPIASFVTRFALRRRRPGRPVVIYTAHGFHFYAGGNGATNAIYRSMEGLAAPWTDYLVTINSEDFEAAPSLGIPAERIRYIPGIGIDTTLYSPDTVTTEQIASVRAGLDLAPTDFALTMIAEMAPVKRHSHMLTALSLVRDTNVKLVLVGTGPLESDLRAQAVALRVADRIRWAGYRRDVPAVLAASDALVLVSEREGLPRSVLEGMSMAKPVIGTETRGITDAVGTDAGWLVDKYDSAALAAAIDAAASDRAECIRRGEAGRAKAISTFSLDHVIRDCEGLYGEALASRV